MAPPFRLPARTGTGFALLDVQMFPPAIMLASDFNSLAANIRSFREPLERSVDQVARPAIGRNFDAEGPGWQPLHENTVKQRGEAHPILNRTGTLKEAAQQKNVWSFSKTDATINGLPSRAYYGAVHNEGSNFIPARPFFVLTEGDTDEIEKVFMEWLGERFEAHGFRRGL